MEHYINAISKDYANFRGRSSRPQFWYFFLFNFIFYLGSAFLGFSSGFPFLLVLYLLFIIIPFFAAITRRLHDSGRSGWWMLIYLIPVIGAIILLVLLTEPSQQEVNAWGRVPGKKDLSIEDHLVE